jgi:hypothetical protein
MVKKVTVVTEKENYFFKLILPNVDTAFHYVTILCIELFDKTARSSLCFFLITFGEPFGDFYSLATHGVVN